MTDTNNTGEKTLGAAPSKTLHLKRPVEQGVVRQSFSHGRSKAVVVEKVVERRVPGSGEAPAREAAPVAPVVLRSPTVAPVAPRGPTSQAATAKAALTPTPPPKTGVVLHTLTEEQREARAKALVGARAREDEDRRRQEAEAKLRAEREARERVEREAAEARKRDEELRRAQDADFKRKTEDEARRRLAGGEPSATPAVTMARKPTTIAAASPTATPAAPPTARAPIADEEESRRVIRRPGAMAQPAKVVLPPRPTRGGEQRNRGRLTVTSATAGEEERTRSVVAFRRRTQRLKGHGLKEAKEKLSREIVLPETITIQELANRMSERAVDVIKLLMKQGQMATITDVLEADTAQLIAEELGHTVKRVAESDVEEGLFDRPDEEGAPAPRAPIVTIMGHVDHGKTSLLDAIRKANVAAGEAGGITQHIGADQVGQKGREITVLHTPCPAAFTKMRSRGASGADVAVLVVAADDGFMPQTDEALKIALAVKEQQPEKFALIVAVNKIDSKGANLDQVKGQMQQRGIAPEDWGGETVTVPISALKGTGVNDLLEMILLQADVLELKANPDADAAGIVVESQIDVGRGPLSTLIVQRGTLRVGDAIVCGPHWAKVRAMFDDQARPLKAAPP